MYNYTIARIWGIPIRIHVSLLVVLPIFAWLLGSGAQIDVYADLLNVFVATDVDVDRLLVGNRPWIIGISAAVGLFASVAVHELGHAWAAMRYGIGVDSITLWLHGGLASLQTMPREWSREFWIAIAGPLTSVLVAIACLVTVQFIPPETAPVVFFVVGWLGVVNLTLTAFNLIPAFPMDGGRIFRALLARNRPHGTATRLATRLGKSFAIFFAILGVFTPAPMLLLLALFIYVAASGESRAAVLDELLEGLTVDDLATSDETLSDDVSVGEALDRLLAARRSDLPVSGSDGIVEGALSVGAIRSVDPANYETTTVRDLLETDLPRIDATASAYDGLILLDRSRTNVALVERADEDPSSSSRTASENDGRVVGIVSRADYTSVLEFRQENGPF